MNPDLKHIQELLPMYLNSGVEYEYITEHTDGGGGLYPVQEELDYDNIELVINNSKSRKMILYKLSDLDKPIRVEGYADGKEFVPMDDLLENEAYPEQSRHTLKRFDEDNSCLEEFIPFKWIRKLILWHFWIGRQDFFEKGDLIDKMKYEQKT